MAMLALAGCTTSNTQVAAPVAATETVSTEGPQDTGSFPNLNVPPQVAAPQLTNAEKNAKLVQLSRDRAGQTMTGGQPKLPSPGAMSVLARTHGTDTLKRIEGKCDPALDPTCK